MNEIRFYRATGAYGFLSNLWRRQVVFEEQRFSSAEHAYQYGKPMEPKVAEWLMQAPYPSLVAQLAHHLFKWQVRSDWNQNKVERMRAVLRAKFEQNPHLGLKLVQTGNAELIEASRTDTFWGIGKNGKGQNMLGRLLMQLRAELRRRRDADSERAANAIVRYPRRAPRSRECVGECACADDTKAPAEIHSRTQR